MYFFTELSKLNNQSINGYGPVSTNLTTQYEIGANFQLSSNARAFACEDSLMIVQQNVIDPNLVNIILRPIKGLAVSTETVQYYVYRGILKSGFVTAGSITPSGTSGNSDFLERFWENWNTYKAEILYTGANPTPKATFGFDELVNQANDILIENIFNNTTSDTRAIKVSAGEWVGDFDSSKSIVYEIIMNSNHIQDFDGNNPDYLRMDLEYFRKEKHIVDVTNVDPVSGTPLTVDQKAFKLKIRREEILSFIDPAAFYGLYYYIGIKSIWDNSGTWETQKIKKQDLYSELITKFETKNRIYIDIRSEFGFSYDFYDNYKMPGTNALLRVKSDSAPTLMEDLYYTHEWPIFYAASWVSTNPKNRIELQFRVDDENPNPLIYLENPKFKGIFNKKKFIFWDTLPAVSPDPNPYWTDSLKLKFPNVGGGVGANIATYIRLQYFRKDDYAGNFPTKVIKGVSNLDTVFGGLKLPSIDGLSDVFKHNKSQTLQLVRGGEFSFVAYPESYEDNSDNILFFTEIEYANKKRNSQRPKKQFKGNTITESPVFPQNMAFQKVLLREDDGSGTYSDVYSIDLVEFISKKKKSTHLEDVFALGLEKTEYESLITGAKLADLSEKHPIFIVFEKQSHLPEENNIPYDKYKLTMQGLNTFGNLTKAFPVLDIFVYTQGGQIFATNSFSYASNIPVGHPDPAYIKQWDHVGTAHYRNNSTNAIPFTVSDFGNSGFSTEKPEIYLNANVFYPADYEGVKEPNLISSIESNYPLIVIIHGNGQNYEDYNRVLKNLARNGFIAASIDCKFSEDKIFVGSLGGTSNYFIIDGTTYKYDHGTGNYEKNDISLGWVPALSPPVRGMIMDIATPPTFVKLPTVYTQSHGMGALGRANVLFYNLEKLKNMFNSKVQNNIGLIGHSRGGEAILTAERLISSQTIPDVTGVDNISALFSLAPTDQYRIEKLQTAIPYFVLYGSKDGDLKTARVGNREDPYNYNVLTTIVGGTGFSLWDRATNQEKSMIFIHGATHNGFVTDNWRDYSDRPVANSILNNTFGFIASETKQKLMLDAYTNAFFRKELKLENFWSDFFSGEWKPPSVIDTNAKLHLQYIHPLANSLENFENVSDDSDFSDGKAIGILKTEISSVVVDKYSPHGNKIIQLDVSTFPTYEVYDGPDLNAGNYSFFSFRIAKKYRSISDTDLKKLEVKIYNGLMAYSLVVATEIPDGYKRLDKEDYSKSTLISIRLSFDDFVGLDKTAISKIELAFGTTTGTVQLDDFEFTN